MVVSKQVKLIIKYRLSQKSVFKTKGLYRFLEKDTSISYCLKRLPFREGLGMPERKVK